MKFFLYLFKSGQLFVFDLAANELLETIKAHEGVVWSIMPTPDMVGYLLSTLLNVISK